MAYMRMSKVLLALETLGAVGIDLRNKRVFDYGFGAGTFFWHCPASARLSGVEMDLQNIEEVAERLRARGYRHLDLRRIEIESWADHPLLNQEYDLFLCSHVLEHLPDPAAFLRRVRSCIAPGGRFIGLVPLNERAENPHHVAAPDRAMIGGWAREAGYVMSFYEENDPFLYWFQPLFAADSGWRHKAAQAVSLGLGVAVKALGRRAWFALAPLFARATSSLPTQAVFLLEPL